MPPSNGVPVYTKSEGVRRRSRVSFPSWFPTSRQEKRSTPKFRALSLSLSLSLARAREREQRRRARQKRETRVYQNKMLLPSAPYKAKCHSKISSSKGSAHVANAFGSASSCASASANSFISCEMRRTAALFEEDEDETEEAIVFVSFVIFLYVSMYISLDRIRARVFKSGGF